MQTLKKIKKKFLKKAQMDLLFLDKVDLKIMNITSYTEAHFIMTKDSLSTTLNK